MNFIMKSSLCTMLFLILSQETPMHSLHPLGIKNEFTAKL